MYEMKREPDGTYVFSVPNGRYVLPGKSESEAYRFRRETIASGSRAAMRSSFGRVTIGRWSS
jgi:hypothetical protein